MSHNGGTLESTERRLAPITLACVVACAAVGATLLALSANVASPLWVTCLALWLALTGFNAWYLLGHNRPSVGMAPVAAVSLGPAALAHAVSNPGGAIAVLDAILMGGAALIAVTFCAMFARMRATYSPAAPVADDAVVIVLGGAVRDGRPRPTLARRLNKAAAIAQQHPNVTLVLTGGPTRDGRTTEADIMARYLTQQGIRPEQMVLEPTAINTKQNLLNSLELIREQGLGGQLCVLSSDYHLYRAVRLGARLGVRLVPIASATSAQSRLQQWSREVLTILAGR